MLQAVVRSQDPAVYLVPGVPDKTKEDDKIISQALNILSRRIKKPGVYFSNPDCVKEYLMLQTAGLEHEVFIVLLLDVQNNLLHHEQMFRGTATQTSVYPRELVKLVLKHNASAVVFCHNHPSGTTQPSRADELLTSTLKTTLALVDCRVLDHIIVSGCESLSMAERGMM